MKLTILLSLLLTSCTPFGAIAGGAAVSYAVAVYAVPTPQPILVLPAIPVKEFKPNGPRIS